MAGEGCERVHQLEPHEPEQQDRGGPSAPRGRVRTDGRLLLVVEPDEAADRIERRERGPQVAEHRVGDREPHPEPRVDDDRTDRLGGARAPGRRHRHDEEDHEHRDADHPLEHAVGEDRLDPRRPGTRERAVLEPWFRPQCRERDERDGSALLRHRRRRARAQPGDRVDRPAAPVGERRGGGGEERRHERGEDRSPPDQGTISSSNSGSPAPSSSTS